MNFGAAPSWASSSSSDGETLDFFFEDWEQELKEMEEEEEMLK
jgi:hypothetical protein